VSDVEPILTEQEREGIKKLASEQPRLLYCIVEEILRTIPNADELLRRAFVNWQG
jgi:hypothetical protein